MEELSPGAWIRYEPTWLREEEADALYAALAAELRWEERPIVVAGREVLQPRLIAWEGEVPYRYSGQTLPGVPLSDRALGLVERASAYAGGPFNHVLFNWYRDGRDNIGFHADNEPELGRNPLIASLSLGATRRFRLERKGRRRTRREIDLSHGSLLVMGGTTQHHWYHAVPKAPGCTEGRINVTFRWLRGPPGWREPARSEAQASPRMS